MEEIFRNYRVIFSCSTRGLRGQWNFDIPDLVSRLLSIATDLARSHHDQQSDILTPLSLALRLLLVHRKCKHSGAAEKRHKELLGENMTKLWCAAVWGDSELWTQAAAISATGFDEKQLEEIMASTMLYKLLCEAKSGTGGSTSQSRPQDDKVQDHDDIVETYPTDFEYCVEKVMREKDIISPAVFDHSLHTQKTEQDRKQLKAVNELSRKQILVVVEKCVNFASIV